MIDVSLFMLRFLIPVQEIYMEEAIRLQKELDLDLASGIMILGDFSGAFHDRNEDTDQK